MNFPIPGWMICWAVAQTVDITNMFRFFLRQLAQVDRGK